MATTRIIPLHTGKGRTVNQAISQIIDYVSNPSKTGDGKYISGFECDTRTADAEFLLMKRQYTSSTGRVRGKDDVIAYQVRQSFPPDEITPEKANQIGVEFAKRFTKGNHAFVVCTHIDKAHIHNHIIWSSVNLECNRKFRNFWGSTKAVRRLSDTICIENGLSIIENPKCHGLSYNKWLGDKKKTSHRDTLKQKIDNALKQQPTDLNILLKLLEQSGCEVIYRGKSISLHLKDWKKSIRLNSLGNGYTEHDLICALSKKQTITSPLSPESTNINLLIDIEAKLKAGKGIGYERWAKVFNLKHMATTINYLTEHNLLDYNELQRKTNNAVNYHHTLSEKIKNTEKRMNEIATLKTHIINYSRTRDIYIAYRKSGYSKKFLSEHEAEILIHKAAKQAFNEMNITKLPTIKNLQTEYSSLLNEKQKSYAEYRKARDEMRKLLTAKANVDRLLNIEPQNNLQKEKDHGQR